MGPRTNMTAAANRAGRMRALPWVLLAAGLALAAYLAYQRRSAGSPALDCPDVEHLLSQGGRLAAMIGVHAHALPERAHTDAMEVSRALTVLDCDVRAGALGARSRKRRAVAELVAYGRFDRFAEELAAVGVDLSGIRKAVRRAYPGTAGVIENDPALLEMVVSNLVGADPPLAGLPAADAPAAATGTGTCDWVQEEPFQVWHTGPVITFSGAVSVKQSVPVVRKNLDPQRWDTCGMLWGPPPPDGTRVVAKTGPGQFQEAPAGSIPKPGTSYGWTPLFEHFACDAPGCLGWFENVLHVRVETGASMPSAPGSTGTLITYSLAVDDALDGCVGSADAACAGGTQVLVKTDQGWLEIWRKQHRTMVRTHKDVLFDNAVANGIAAALFAHAELARELGEMACCLRPTP